MKLATRLTVLALAVSMTACAAEDEPAPTEEQTPAATTVTVTQLAVRIDQPLDGARVLGDSTVTIAGRALSVLNGAAIDSIVVEIGGDPRAEPLQGEELADAEGDHRGDAAPDPEHDQEQEPPGLPEGRDDLNLNRKPAFIPQIIVIGAF